MGGEETTTVCVTRGTYAWFCSTWCACWQQEQLIYPPNQADIQMSWHSLNACHRIASPCQINHIHLHVNINYLHSY